MSFSAKHARREMQTLDLPEFFIELNDGATTLDELEIRRPSRIFQLPYTHPHSLTPLFEHGLLAYCLEQHPEGRRYIAFNPARPSEVTVFGASFQCALAGVFMTLWDDERNDIILPMLAERMEFDFLPELLDEIGAANKLAREPFFRWKQQFWQRCEVTAPQTMIPLESSMTEYGGEWPWQMAV